MCMIPADQTYPAECACHNNYSRSIRCNDVGLSTIPSQLKMSGSVNRLCVFVQSFIELSKD